MRARLALALALGGLAPAAGATTAECIFQMDGKDVLVGPCEGTEPEPTKAFSIASPDGTLVALVASKGGGVGEAFWNGAVRGPGADILIGSVVLVGACWVSDKTKLCMAR